MQVKTKEVNIVYGTTLLLPSSQLVCQLEAKCIDLQYMIKGLSQFNSPKLQQTSLSYSAKILKF